MNLPLTWRETGSHPLSAGAPSPPTAALDFLGRLPVPLRRPFKIGLDRAVAAHRAAGGAALRGRLLGGAEWRNAFDALPGVPVPPALLITPLAPDVLSPGVWDRYRSSDPRAAHSLVAGRPDNVHPACRTLLDPSGTFHTFAVVPFVLLVDTRRLAGRPAPDVWEDLLAPHWRGDIVFGGWRPNDDAPYHEHNTYLLYALRQAFGDDGLKAFARNVRHLQHHIRSAVVTGSNSPDAATITVLPWMQAQLCPRRERTQVVWPRDGALAMPIGAMLRPGAAAHVAPVLRYLRSTALALQLAHNAYPAIHTGPGALSDPLPPGARLRWPGWDHLLGGDYGQAGREAAARFFAEQALHAASRSAQGAPECN